MIWTAVLPLKQGHDRKSRLAGQLSPEARALLSDHMAAHVLAVLRDSPSIGPIVLLSPEPAAQPGILWHGDQGRGLNAELDAMRIELGSPAMVILHGDLPLLTPDDIAALTGAAAAGCAIAPDRHGSGTNAVAIAAGRSFVPAFGADSFDRHREAAMGLAAIVTTTGLSFDVDTPADLDAAIAAGADFPADIVSRA